MTRQFLFRCWIEVFVASEHVLDGLYVMLPIYLMEWLGASLQRDRRVDTPEAGSNHSRADGLSTFSFTDVASKSRGHSGDGLKITLVQVRRYFEMSAVGLPFVPYFFPSVGSRLHSAIDDPRVSSSEITFVLTAPLRWNPVQEF